MAQASTTVLNDEAKSRIAISMGHLASRVLDKADYATRHLPRTLAHHLSAITRTSDAPRAAAAALALSAAAALALYKLSQALSNRLAAPPAQILNPHYGLARVRTSMSSLSNRSPDALAPSSPGAAAAAAPPPQAHAFALPHSVLSKHPKGFGVQLVRTTHQVVHAGLMPIVSLATFFKPAMRSNRLFGSAEYGDYNQLQDATKSDVILGDIVRKAGAEPFSRAYLRAGPRETLFFEPKHVKAAIVTCGGLCPGLNNVVRETTLTLLNLYGAHTVYGVRGGYRGFVDGSEPIRLTRESVAKVNSRGGSVLGSARGGFDVEAVLRWCRRYGVSQLYVVGGDGTHRAANIIGREAIARKLHLAVACIPKTIDNDLDLIDRSFGFNTAVAAAQQAINVAKVEAECNLPNGIGIVKLMGRHAGFVAAHAALASGKVDLCLVPEVPIELEGQYGCLPHIERVLERKGHAVIVVAEGAGEELLGEESTATDAGGNRKLPEIGPFFKTKVGAYFAAKRKEVTIKYIDPSYMIRAVPADSSDSIFCMLLSQNAVHGAMAGYTCFTTGLVCNRTVYIPIPAITENSPRMMDRCGRTWERIISVTGQPNRPVPQEDRPSANAVQPATIF